VTEQNDSRVEIRDVVGLPYDRELVREFSLDLPRPGSTIPSFTIDLAGWVLGARRRVVSVEITSLGQPLKRLPVNLPRVDVAGVHDPGMQGESCGFAGQMGSLGTPSDFELVVQALVKMDGDERLRVPVAKITGRRRSRPGVVSKRQPLMVTGLGRSGTSWMMRLLSEHPGVVAIRQHPYEVRPSVYWMHMLKVLTDPADHDRSTSPDGFENDVRWIGSNPYAHPRYTDAFRDPGAMRRAVGPCYVAEVEAFCKRNIDMIYDAVASDQGDDEGRYFAEKLLPSHVQSLFWDFFGGAAEILLVRDFRDQICSARAFNEKRGIVAFGREKASDDLQWVRNMSERGVRRMAEALAQRRERAHLVRYEDLVLRPHETLAGIFAYLGLAADEDAVGRVLRRAGQDTNEARDHRTSADPAASVGRWRTELDGPLLDRIHELMGPALRGFGYEVP